MSSRNRIVGANRNMDRITALWDSGYTRRATSAKRTAGTNPNMSSEEAEVRVGRTFLSARIAQNDRLADR